MLIVAVFFIAIAFFFCYPYFSSEILSVNQTFELDSAVYSDYSLNLAGDLPVAFVKIRLK